MTFDVQPIGRVESPITDVRVAACQGDEGAPEAVVVFDARVQEAMRDLRPGDEILLLTWLHRARRDVLAVHPRGDERRPVQGVFSTRSPDRPNPIGLHPVRVVATEGARMTVSNLEAVDGTPVIDVKPVLAPIGER
jgi:tRNA-Thr(GGU) m(6)t(6)A37 methyltransferase TsaA